MRRHHQVWNSVRSTCDAQGTVCTTQLSEVNVVIGVVLVELHVVRVVPVVVCDDAVVLRTLVLIALCRSHCFRCGHFS